MFLEHGGSMQKDISPRPIALETSDGVVLGGRVFDPIGRSRATVVIHGATATRQRYYGAFATELARRGLRVITYDYRGIGESRGRSLRGFSATMTEWATRDAVAAMNAAVELDEPLVLVGHSFGGQLLGLVEIPAAAKGIVLVGAQFGYHGHWPAPRKLAYGLLWRLVVPVVVRAFGYLPGHFGLGVDLPAGVALEWARWCSRPNYLLDDYPQAVEAFEAIDRPTLFYSFTDDLFAPKNAVDAYLRALSPATFVHRRFDPRVLGRDGIGHFGYFRSGVVPSLWNETVRFVNDVLADRTPSVVDNTSITWEIGIDEIEADLAYGRA
jgi:predicted alpha/beta hydrolase